MSEDALPPGTTGDTIAKRFGPDDYRCPQCGDGWLCLERIKDDDGWTSNRLVCASCNYVCDDP